MSLLVYNLTAAPLVLANGLSTTIPASTAGVGVRGLPWYASGDELNGRSPAEYTALQAQQDSGVVQFEWEASPEYDTYPLVVGSPPLDVAENDIAIYADVAAGDDANPGTAALPVKTFNAAWSLLPTAWWKQCKIFFAPGAYAMDPVAYFAGKPVGSKATPLCLIGSKATVQTLTATLAGSSLVVTDATAGMTPNAFYGAAILCTFGANAGSRAFVAGNTATTVTLNAAFSSPITLNDTFIIERPTTVIAGAGATFTDVGVGLKDIKFTAFGNDFVFDINSTIYAAENLEVETDAGGRFLTVVGTTVVTVSDPTFFASDGADNPFSFFSFYCGAYYHGPGQVRHNGGNLFESAVFQDLAQYSLENEYAIFLQISAQNVGTVRMDDSSRGGFGGNFNNAPITAFQNGIYFFGGDVSNSPADAISLLDGSLMFIFGVTGTGNGGVGITTQNMSRSGLIGNTVTGAGGDTKVGAIVKTYAALPYSEVDGSGPTLNRIELGF